MEKGYKKLKVFQEANRLVTAIYYSTTNFPKHELFGLISQMRRAAVSVTANIVEGQARTSKKEFKRFLSIANGSLAELEYYLELALELTYLKPIDFDALEKQRILVGSLLGGLLRYLKS